MPLVSQERIEEILHPLGVAVDLAVVQEVARRHGVLLLALFGSSVKGRRHAGSDLDIAVLLPPLPEQSVSAKHTALTIELEDALRPRCELDVVVLNRSGPLLQKAVGDHGVPIYLDSAARWSAFRIRARKNVEDTAKYRRRRWESLQRWVAARCHDTPTAGEAGAAP